MYKGRSSEVKVEQHRRNNHDEVEMHTPHGNVDIENRFVIELECPQRCQFMNAHSVPVSNILNCNTNVQAGDSNQTYHKTIYHTKNTQKEDSELRNLVAEQVTIRLS